MNNKKILVFEFHQETNDFNPIVTPFERFHPKKIFEGEERFQGIVLSKGVASGGVNAIWEAGGEVIHTVFMHSGSGGRVDDAVYDYLSSNYVGFCAADIETSVKNHLIGFAAEEARITDRVVYMADYLQI